MKSFSTTMSTAILCGVFLQGALLADDCSTGGQLGIERTLTTATMERYGISVGGSIKYAADRDYAVKVTAYPRTLSVSQPDPEELWSGNFFAAYGLNGFLDISADLSYFRDEPGWRAVSNSLGDLGIAAKLRYPDVKAGAFFSAAYYLKIILPTGGGSRGFFPRNSYYVINTRGDSMSRAVYTDDVVYLNPMFVWTFDFSTWGIPGKLHSNIGVVHGAGTQATALAAALAVEIKAAPSLALFAELTGEARVKYFVDPHTRNPFAKDPVRFSPGISLILPGGFHGLIALDVGIADNDPAYRANWDHEGFQYSTKAVPRWGGQLILGWTGRTRMTDGDRDSVPDIRDRCRGLAEDHDGFEDTDGCPDFDNDRDSVPDTLDRCRGLAEDHDGFEDTDGCPDFDNDRDSVPDTLDRCQNQAEDRDGFEDTDGCPDFDNDRDGIADATDRCPDAAEDFDGFDDMDGCPDYDNDRDGTTDSLDKCPSAAGPAETGGCPASEGNKNAARRGPLILNSVMFAGGENALTASSRETLDQVALSLREWGEVTVEVQGHCDITETAEGLSEQRASAVKEYLVSKGIASERLRTVGYEKSKPLASNNSALGRQKNRRVEFRRVD